MTKKCDLATGLCVRCVPGDDDCPVGFYCTAANVCSPGCKSNAECNAGPEPDVFTCDPATHACLGCTADGDCPAGAICGPTTACVPGCNPGHACDAGKDCCSGACVILALDLDHCGACDAACPPDPAFASALCQMGTCGLVCDAFRADCNDDPVDGCEVDVKTDAANCSICGNACPPNETCQNGACAP